MAITPRSDASELTFPRDEGAHPRAKNEWWYFNSHLTSDGREFGLHFNFVRDRLVVMLADCTKGEMICRRVLTGARLRGSQTGFDLNFGDSWWRQEGGPGTYEARVDAGEVSAVLTMKSRKPPLLLDGVGRVKEGLLGESYYYAQTRLDVTGSLGLNGGRVAVRGVGWVDRQWGDWEWTGLGAWHWFSAQLEGGVDLIGFVVRHPLSRGVVTKVLNVSKAGGEVEVVSPFTVFETARWKSPRSGLDYGRSWRVEAGHGTSLDFRARFPDQELQPGFWEGKCSVEGRFEGDDVTGVGYFEQADPVVPFGRGRWFLCMPAGVVNRVVARATRGSGPDLWAHIPVRRA